MTNVIVSVTTTRARLKYLRYALESLRLQTLRPSRVVLNISRERHLGDEGIDELPGWLEEHEVQVRWVPNIGSYRKLIPTLQAAAESDLVVTMDDDILYGSGWLERLVQHAIEHPTKIIAARARRIRRTPFGGWQNYRFWELINEPITGGLVLPTGGAGAVYRMGLLDIAFLTDLAFLELAPTADDLWFRMASLLRGVPVLVDPAINRDNTFLRHEAGLEQTNFRRAHGMWNRVLGRRIGGVVKGKLGINDTPNDYAWDAICRYAQWSPRHGPGLS